MSEPRAPTMTEIRLMVAGLRRNKVPTTTINGEECYLMTLPAENAQAAFEAGLEPFCPLPQCDWLASKIGP